MKPAFRGVLAVLVPAALGAQPSAQLPANLQRGVVVVPDTVTVGDPFRVVIRVRAPAGQSIEFPVGPDSGAAVEALDPVDVAIAADSTAVEQTATYRVAAWDVGLLRIRFPDILVRDGPRARRLPVGTNVRVFVASVLPADTTLHAPRPVRALFEFGLPWWLWLVAAALAAIVLAPFVWWWTRRRRTRDRPADPYEEALREFRHIEAMGLVGAGERGHYIAVVTDVLRTYLSRVIDAAPTSRTTSELTGVLRGDERVPLSRLSRVLHEADLVKFAAQRVSELEAVQIGTESQQLVDVVHAAASRVPEREAA